VEEKGEEVKCSAARGSTVEDQALIESKVERLVEFMHSELLSKPTNNLPQNIILAHSLPLPRRTPTVGWSEKSAEERSGERIGAKRETSDEPFVLAFFGAPLPLFFLSSISCSLCFSSVSTSPISGNWRTIEESDRVGG
jgi:hypothetical protein